MPSIKALLLALFLAIFAVLIIALFVKKSKPVPTAEFYAKLNPNCTTIKIHSNKNSLVECFLNFSSQSDFPEEPLDADTQYMPMAKFIGDKFPQEFPLRIRRVFSFPDEITDTIEIYGSSIIAARGKKTSWHNKKNGCKFPGPCPVMPRSANAVNSVLPGKILKIEQDSLYSLTIYHGQNIYSKIIGLEALSDYAELGKNISTDSALGFLPQKDSKLLLEISRNGKAEKWEKFYKETHSF